MQAHVKQIYMTHIERDFQIFHMGKCVCVCESVVNSHIVYFLDLNIHFLNDGENMTRQIMNFSSCIIVVVV